MVRLVVRPAGWSPYRRCGRCYRHWGQLDDRPQIRYLSASVLAESGTVLLVFERDEFRPRKLLAGENISVSLLFCKVKFVYCIASVAEVP